MNSILILPPQIIDVNFARQSKLENVRFSFLNILKRGCILFGIGLQQNYNLLFYANLITNLLGIFENIPVLLNEQIISLIQFNLNILFVVVTLLMYFLNVSNNFFQIVIILFPISLYLTNLIFNKISQQQISNLFQFSFLQKISKANYQILEFQNLFHHLKIQRNLKKLNFVLSNYFKHTLECNNCSICSVAHLNNFKAYQELKNKDVMMSLFELVEQKSQDNIKYQFRKYICSERGIYQKSTSLSNTRSIIFFLSTFEKTTQQNLNEFTQIIQFYYLLDKNFVLENYMNLYANKYLNQSSIQPETKIINLYQQMKLNNEIIDLSKQVLQIKVQLINALIKEKIEPDDFINFLKSYHLLIKKLLYTLNSSTVDNQRQQKFHSFIYYQILKSFSKSQVLSSQMIATTLNQDLEQFNSSDNFIIYDLTSFVSNKICSNKIKHFSKNIPEMFGYENTEFGKIDSINKLLPLGFEQIHNSLIRSFLKDKEIDYFRDQKEVQGLNKEGKLIKLKLQIHLGKIDQYNLEMIIRLESMTNYSNQIIIWFDEQLEITNYNKNFENFLDKQLQQTQTIQQLYQVNNQKVKYGGIHLYALFPKIYKSNSPLFSLESQDDQTKKELISISKLSIDSLIFYPTLYSFISDMKLPKNKKSKDPINNNKILSEFTENIIMSNDMFNSSFCKLNFQMNKYKIKNKQTKIIYFLKIDDIESNNTATPHQTIQSINQNLDMSFEDHNMVLPQQLEMPKLTKYFDQPMNSPIFDNYRNVLIETNNLISQNYTSPQNLRDPRDLFNIMIDDNSKTQNKTFGLQNKPFDIMSSDIKASNAKQDILIKEYVETDSLNHNLQQVSQKFQFYDQFQHNAHIPQQFQKLIIFILVQFIVLIISCIVLQVKTQQSINSYMDQFNLMKFKAETMTPLFYTMFSLILAVNFEKQSLRNMTDLEYLYEGLVIERVNFYNWINVQDQNPGFQPMIFDELFNYTRIDLFMQQNVEAMQVDQAFKIVNYNLGIFNQMFLQYIQNNEMSLIDIYFDLEQQENLIDYKRVVAELLANYLHFNAIFDPKPSIIKDSVFVFIDNLSEQIYLAGIIIIIINSIFIIPVIHYIFQSLKIQHFFLEFISLVSQDKYRVELVRTSKLNENINDNPEQIFQFNYHNYETDKKSEIIEVTNKKLNKPKLTISQNNIWLGLSILPYLSIFIYSYTLINDAQFFMKRIQIPLDLYLDQQNLQSMFPNMAVMCQMIQDNNVENKPYYRNFSNFLNFDETESIYENVVDEIFNMREELLNSMQFDNLYTSTFLKQLGMQFQSNPCLFYILNSTFYQYEFEKCQSAQGGVIKQGIWNQISSLQQKFVMEEANFYNDQFYFQEDNWFSILILKKFQKIFSEYFYEECLAEKSIAQQKYYIICVLFLLGMLLLLFLFWIWYQLVVEKRFLEMMDCLTLIPQEVIRGDDSWYKLLKIKMEREGVVKAN